MLRSTLAPAEPDWTGFWQGVVRGIEDRREPRTLPAPRRWWQSAWRPRWALGGALAAMLVAAGVWLMAPGARPSEAGVVVTSASTEAPHGTVMVYSTREQDVAVVWVFGLDEN